MKLRPTKKFLAATMAALTLGLAGCGGGGDDDRPASEPRTPPQFARLVSFGDSLSDVGSYRVSAVAALGGGQFTVNGPGARNWTERVAQQIGVAAPCAAQTGLESTAPQIPPAPVTDHAGCWAYAQGGARVRDPVGPYNKALLDQGNPQGALGALTKPVSEQIARHLTASGGTFRGTELVTVWAGGNDLLMQLATLSATVAAGGNPVQAAEVAVAAMSAAGTDLATQVKESVLGKGATHVVVMTLPDGSLTPFGQARDEATRLLIRQMSQSFNAALAAGLPAGETRLLVVDLFGRSQQQFAAPADFGIGSITQPACDLARLQQLYQLSTSLVCTGSTLVAGDVSRHFYADDVHPAPFGYQLIGDFVLEQMKARGWR